MEKGVTVYPKVGVPQGSLVSPLLSNIYLNEFDIFMEKLVAKYSTTKTVKIAKTNPEWQRLTYQISKLAKVYESTGETNILEKIKALRKQRCRMDSKTRIGTRVYYVRYADDWVVGILGPASLAINIKSEIKDYLVNKLKLELSDEKTKITNLTKDRA